MKKLCQIIFIFFIFQNANAQHLEKFWEHAYSELPNAVFNDIFQTFDGKLILVGEVKTATNSNESDGLLLMVDEQTGKILLQKRFKNNGHRINTFYSGIQADDGILYLIGACGNEKKDRDGWLVAVNFDASSEIRNEASGMSGDDSFEKIVKLSDGSPIIIGQKTNTGDIRFLKINHHGKTESNFDTDKNYGKIISAQVDDEDNIHVFGRMPKNGCAWWTQFDASGHVKSKKIVGNENTTADLETAILNEETPASAKFFGNSYRKGESDIWVADVAQDKNTFNEKIYGSHNAEYLRYATKLPNGKFLHAIAVPDKHKNFLFNQISYLDTDDLNNAVLNLGSERDLSVKLLKTGLQNAIWIVGSSIDNGQVFGKIICLKSANLSAAKAETRLDCSTPALIDDNGDGIISQNERASINFWTTNSGETDIMEGRVEVRIIQAVSGLTLPYATLFMDYLPKGKKKKLSIPLFGDKNLNAGIASFEISVTVNGRALCTKQISVKTGKAISFNRPIVELQGNANDPTNRNLRSQNASYTLKGKVYADRPLTVKDFAPLHNGALLTDAKENATDLKIVEEGGRFVHYYTRKINLTEGINTVALKINMEGEEIISSPLNISFTTRQPNLHVVLISPESDLQFNKKDAEDFATAIEKQRGAGIYNDITIEKFTDAKKTTTAKIKGIFSKMLNRATGKTDEDFSEKDILMVFISSHGKRINDRFKIIPSDYDSDDDLNSTVDYKSDILEPLQKINCKKIILIDACHSGDAKGKSKGTPNDLDLSNVLNELNAASPGILTISSSAGDELSYEIETSKNGAFTQGIIEALENKKIELANGISLTANTDGDNFLSIEELFKFLQLRVPDLVKRSIGKTQTPYMPINQLKESLKIFVLK